MKILIDTNIVLDLLLEREPFVETAIALFQQIEHGKLAGYIAATLSLTFFTSSVKPKAVKSPLPPLIGY